MFLTLIKDRSLISTSTVNHDSKHNAITIRINPKQYRINTDSVIVEAAINAITYGSNAPKAIVWFKGAIRNMSSRKNLSMACINI